VTEVLGQVRQHEPSSWPRLILDGAEDSTRREPPPSWRGVLHEKAFALAPAMALLLVSSADGARARIAAAVFATTMTWMLAVSAVNHRAPLRRSWEPWLRRADHAAINIFIAGTWTSIALITLTGTTRVMLTALVWGAAVAASLVTLLWVEVPGWIPASIAVAIGWSAAPALLDALAPVDAPGIALFLLGGVLYTSGALVYALRRPELHSAFGYHEVFHLLVLAGVACHYLTLAFFVLPLAE
jgi:hemolysin III